MGVQTEQSPGAEVAEPPPSAEVDAAVADTRPLPPDEAVDAWAQVKRAFAALLRNPAPDAAWVESLQALKQRMQVLARRDFDTALYLLMQDAAAGEDRYSAHHSLLCGLVAEVCADWYEWSPAEMDALVLSALSMNVSMSAMQDALTRQVQPLSPAQREQVQAHPEKSAEMLAAAGVQDTLWVDVVRRHHDASTDGAPDSDAPARLARLLRRVDVYTAKLSSRAGRSAVTPAKAARDTCLGPDGKPDAVGAGILRKLGLYPPGSFVKLANGDLGVVIKRGVQAHMPLVAALRRSDGGLYPTPKKRDTTQRVYAVAHGVTVRELKVHLNHLRNLTAA